MLNCRRTVSFAAVLVVWSTGCNEDSSCTLSPGQEIDPGTEMESEPDAGSRDTATSEDTESGLPALDMWDPPTNVVLFIGDGMGAAQADAGAMMKNGEAGTLSFQSFPVTGMMTVNAAGTEKTDSASSATAMATGVKVGTDILALEIPGDAHALPTLLDFYAHLRKSTGIVSTCALTDATPAAFTSHGNDRYNNVELAWHFFHTSRPNILFGGGGLELDILNPEQLGYQVIETLDGYADLANPETPYILGAFGDGNFPYEWDGLEDRPHLTEMSAAALDTLSLNDNGFFAMVEGGRIDDAAHAKSLKRVVAEVVEFDNTVAAALEILDLKRTLVIVTADHSTGGLEIVKNNGKGELPDVTWVSAEHDPDPVPFYATGKGADTFQALLDLQGGFIDNTDIYHVLTVLPEVASDAR